MSDSPADPSTETPMPVWQLRMTSSDWIETYELHVEVAAPTAAAAVKIAKGRLVSQMWFVDEDTIKEKTGPKRYEVEERREVRVFPDLDDEA
ncbi:MAG: hypothetical protein OHK0022_22030 [Roseiflexaceae bacterium]